MSLSESLFELYLRPGLCLEISVWDGLVVTPLDRAYSEAEMYDSGEEESDNGLEEMLYEEETVHEVLEMLIAAVERDDETNVTVRSESNIVKRECQG